MSFNIQIQFENHPPEWIQRDADTPVREIVDYVVLRHAVLPRQRHTLHVFHNGHQVGETERIGDLIGRLGLENRFVVTRHGLTRMGAHDRRVRIVTPSNRALQRVDAHDRRVRIVTPSNRALQRVDAHDRFREGGGRQPHARGPFLVGIGASLLPPQTRGSRQGEEDIRARLSRMTKIELKSQCRLIGISQQGTKQELINRLMSLT